MPVPVTIAFPLPAVIIVPENIILILSANDVFAVGHSGTALRYAPDVTTTTTTPPTTVPTTIPTTTTTQICPPIFIYGEDSEEVELLRYFRDEVLGKTPEGQELIRLYYEWSPVIIEAMDKDEAFKEEVKVLIDETLTLINTE